MSLLERLFGIGAKRRRVEAVLPESKPKVRRRKMGVEKMEKRELLSADPLNFGAVYYEDAMSGGNDNHAPGDLIHITFNGGADGTQLTQVTINLADNVYFDTAAGGFGTSGHIPLTLVGNNGVENVTFSVTTNQLDGSQVLTITFVGFDAGDSITIGFDVDETNTSNTSPTVEGKEFEGSTITATFSADTYHDTTTTVTFTDQYSLGNTGLNLPDDDYIPPGTIPANDYTAGGVTTVHQTPLPITLSGHVYHDADVDNHFDANEQGIGGVNLTLQMWNGTQYVNTGKTATTDANGHYSFDGLDPGKYRVVETQPDGYYSVGAQTGTVDGATEGQVDNVNVIADVDLVGGQDGVDYNFGEAKHASIEGHVYHDRDNDGVRDAGEEGIGNTIVELLDSNGNVIATTTTDANGHYEFDDLVHGTYTVRETQPSTWLDGKDAVGSAGGTLGDDILSTIVLVSDTHATDYNFGELAPASVEGHVYKDLDNDGIRDAGEEGIGGVLLELRDANGNVIGTTTTDASGHYKFDGLLPGTYTITETQPAGYFDGKEHVGTEGGVLINPDTIGSIGLSSGEHGTQYDFGELPPSSIAGTVYEDRDDDGVRDAGETGIPGAKVELLDANGNVIATTFTDANGNYKFDNLAPGTYGVRETQPSGYYDGKDTAGSIGGNTSTNDQITQIVLPAQTTAVNYNFGELRPGSISGHVHADLDGDCVFDPNEEGIAGVEIHLLDANGNIVATTYTDANGNYSFDNLPPGTYGIHEVQPGDYLDSGDHPGSLGGNVTSNDTISNIVLHSGDVGTNYNFCEIPPSCIGGVVYEDVNNNGVQDSGENGIAGVVLELLDANGNVVGTTTTDANGHYGFCDIYPGKYSIRETQPGGWLDGKDKVGDLGGTLGNDIITNIIVPAGAEADGYDFGELKPGSISGNVHADRDGDCEIDPGEPMIEGVIIQLLDSNGNVIATTTTDANGNYTFNNIPPGTYGIREIQPSNFLDGGQQAGTAGGVVSNDLVTQIVIDSGENATGYNFCEIEPASISGHVWLDEDNDNVWDPGEKSIGGVKVFLLDASGNIIASTFTDANGNYEFSRLYPGSYGVYEVQPGGLLQGGETVGTSGGTIVSQDKITGIELSAGEHGEHYDFSERKGDTPPVINPPEDPPHNPPGPFIQAAPPNPAPWIPAPLTSPVSRPDLGSGIGRTGGGTPDYTWHLSIIDGGTPRGDQIVEDEGVRLTPARLTKNNWHARDLSQGQWLFAKNVGEKGGAIPLGKELFNGRPIFFGIPGAIPVSGDFNGDGVTDVGVYIDGQWYIDLNGNGEWDKGDLWAQLGRAGDRPVTGDWDGDGKTDIGIFGPAWSGDERALAAEAGIPGAENLPTGELKNVPDAERAPDEPRLMRLTSDGNVRTDVIDHVFAYGQEGDIPFVGDWIGDGIDKIAVFRGGKWLLDANGDGRLDPHDKSIDFSHMPGLPVVGDFNGDGVDEVGVFNNGRWHVDTNGDGKLDDLDMMFEHGAAGDTPVVGDWDADGKDDPAVFRPGLKNKAS